MAIWAWFAELVRRSAISSQALSTCDRGNVAIMSAIILPVLVLMAGGTIDYVSLSNTKMHLQHTADAAALASAREINIAQTDPNVVAELAKTYVEANGGDQLAGADISATVDLKMRTITVSVTVTPKTYFSTPLTDTVIHVNSTVRVIGQLPLCVLGLKEDQSRVVHLADGARLPGNGCAVYSNSSSPSGLQVDGGAALRAGMVCSAGGGSGDIEPPLVVDCPSLGDPLGARPTPSSGACDQNDMTIGVESEFLTSQLGQALSIGMEVLPEISESYSSDSDLESETSKIDATETDDSELDDAVRDPPITLVPGVYCGGLKIASDANVVLEPGTYIMQNGPLYIGGNARISGERVGFYFIGEDATMYFGPNTSVQLSAPTSGNMAGLLFFEDRGSREGRLFSILSDDARVLTGTVYLPKATLVIDADRPIADQSAYTAIVSNQLHLYAGPHLVLNTDYEITDVPMPGEIAFNNRVALVN